MYTTAIIAVSLILLLVIAAAVGLMKLCRELENLYKNVRLIMEDDEEEEEERHG